MHSLIVRVLLLLVPVSGCTDTGPLAPPLASPPASFSSEPAPLTKPIETTLKAGTRLNALAVDLDAIAITQSSALQQLNASRAELDAAQFLRYPQFRPSVSLPLTGTANVNAGLNLEQVVLDGGRNSSEIHSAKLKVDDSLLAVWEERNQASYDGLSAFADAVKFEERISVGSALLTTLEEILGQATARAESGFSDRGEVLRINGAINEVRREMVTDTSELERARGELQQLFEKPVNTDGVTMSDLVGMCEPNWLGSGAPRLDRIAIRIEEARISESVIRARMLPRLVLQAGFGIDSSGVGSPTLGLQLDASDLLGLGRKSEAEAASAIVVAAEQTYQIERRDLAVELAVLEQGYHGSLTELQQLNSLRNNSGDTIELFQEQLEAGSISVIDGAGFHRERAQIDRSILDTQHSMLNNCLRASRLRGALAEFKVDYYE